MLASPCLARLGRPVVMMSPRIMKLNFTYLTESVVWVFLSRNIVRRIAHDIYCEIAVARPAPNIPIFIFFIKSASRKIFMKPPVVRPIIAKKARPSYLRILFMTQLDTSAGAANKMHCAYIFAYGRIVGVLPKRRISGVMNIVPNSRKTKPMDRAA